MGLATFTGMQPTLREAVIAKNYLNEKELRALRQLVSGYLDFAERQAERKQDYLNFIKILGKKTDKD